MNMRVCSTSRRSSHRGGSILVNSGCTVVILAKKWTTTNSTRENTPRTKPRTNQPTSCPRTIPYPTNSSIRSDHHYNPSWPGLNRSICGNGRDKFSDIQPNLTTSSLYHCSAQKTIHEPTVASRLQPYQTIHPERKANPENPITP